MKYCKNCKKETPHKIIHRAKPVIFECEICFFSSLGIPVNKVIPKSAPYPCGEVYSDPGDSWGN